MFAFSRADVQRWSAVFLLALFTATAGANTRANSCFPPLAEVGAYHASPATVAENLAKEMTSDTFSFPLPVPLTVKQGDIVDLAVGRPRAPGIPTKNVTEAMPDLFSGIFVGTAKNSRGAETIVIDFGQGQLVSVPTTLIRSLIRSSAEIKPSTGDDHEKTYRRAKLAAWKLQTPWARKAIRDSLPLALSLIPGLAYQFSSPILEWTQRTFQANPYEAMAATAIGLTGLLVSKPARQFVLAAPWVVVQSFRDLSAKMHSQLAMNRMSWASDRILNESDSTRGQVHSVSGVGRVVYQGERDLLRTYLHMADGIPNPEFAKRAEKSVAEAVALKRYLVSMGMPDLRYPLNVWFSSSGIPSIHGPFSADGMNLIYLGPINRSIEDRGKFSEREAARGGNRVLAAEGVVQTETDGLVLGHELTHNFVHRMIATKDREADVKGPIDEALADYFPMSAQNVNEPVLLFNAVFEGLPLREAVQRRYEGPYPEHLNFNTVAQMSGDAHDSSQVIGRYLWKLRTQMGREKLDPLIVKALPYIGRYRRHAETRFGRAPGYGEPGVLVDRFRNQREAFIFVAALMHASRESGESRAKQTAIAKHAGPFGMPLEVLQSIHELPLDAE